MKIGICPEKFCSHNLDINLGFKKKASLSKRLAHKYLPYYSTNDDAKRVKIPKDFRESIKFILNIHNNDAMSIVDMVSILCREDIKHIVDEDNFLRPPKYFIANILNQSIDLRLNSGNISDTATIKKILSILDIEIDKQNTYFYNGNTYTYNELSILFGLDTTIHINERLYERRTHHGEYHYDITRANKRMGVINVNEVEVKSLSKILSSPIYINYINFTNEQVSDILDKVSHYYDNKINFTNNCFLLKLVLKTLESTNTFFNKNGIEYNLKRMILILIENLIELNANNGNQDLDIDVCVDITIFLRKLIDNYNHEYIFNIDGIEYTIEELEDIISLLKKQIQNSVYLNNTDNSNEYETYLRRENQSQSVHNRLVVELAEKNINIMLDCTNQSINITMEEVKSDLRDILKEDNIISINNNAVYSNLICSKFEKLFTDRVNLDFYNDVDRSIGSQLETVCKYIYSQDIDLKRPLLLSLIHRLQEIIIEQPCSVGRLQRILDIGNGIDDRLNNLLSNEYINQGLERLAARMQQSTSEEFERDIKANKALPEITEPIQFDSFKAKALQLYCKFLRVPEQDINQIIEKLKSGFFIESNIL